MEKVLCVLHTDKNGGFSPLAYETLGMAKEMTEKLASAELKAAVWGVDASKTVQTIGAYPATEFLVADSPALEFGNYNNDTQAVTALAKAAGATIIIMQSDSRSNRIAAGVATRLQGHADTHVTQATFDNDKIVVSRWYYKQRILAQLSRKLRPWVLTIETGSAQPWAAEAKDVSVTTVEFTSTAKSYATGTKVPLNDLQTIRPDAKLLFVAGAGWCKKQTDGQVHVDNAEQLILDFIQKAGASLGSSKSLVDETSQGKAVLKFLTHMNQIGQTGSTPRHPKGLSTCCHGEEPHTVGWRFIGQRRAINLDGNCGWSRGKADVLYVADAFEVMKKVNVLLG